MSAFISFPIACEELKDTIGSEGVSIRRQRFPRTYSYRRFRLTYGPATAAEIDTQADVIRALKGGGTTTLDVPNVGTLTGRFGPMSMRYDSPTANYLDVSFTESPRYA